MSDHNPAQAQQVRESMRRLIAEAERMAARLGLADVAETLRKAKDATVRGTERNRNPDWRVMLR